MRRQSLAAAAIASMACLPACNDDGNDEPIELPMPTFFEMRATAEAQEGDLTVSCSIGFVVEITGEVSRTRDVVEYIAIMGGDAVRDLRRPDGSGITQVTDGSTNDGMPSWSPDGNEVVFRVASRAVRGLYILNLATGDRRRLSTGSDYDTFPSWSPSGDWISFTSFRDGNYEIYRVRPDGTDVQRLTNLAGNDAHSTFSPDGEWIAFTTSKQGFKDESLPLVIGLLPPPFQAYGEIAVMRIDGSELSLLSDNSIEEGWPVWIPDRR